MAFENTWPAVEEGKGAGTVRLGPLVATAYALEIATAPPDVPLSLRGLVYRTLL